MLIVSIIVEESMPYFNVDTLYWIFFCTSFITGITCRSQCGSFALSTD